MKQSPTGFLFKLPLVKGKNKMKANAQKAVESGSKAIANSIQKKDQENGTDFSDQRPEAFAEKALSTSILNSATVQAKKNNTGLPDNLKSGVEALSGHSMDDVKVHYNSSKPSQLNAHAYAQGTQIHLAPGQNQHLPHEAWHVAQQKQGRVQPTTQVNGSAVNDDVGLETEADVMGTKAFQLRTNTEKSITYGKEDSNSETVLTKHTGLIHQLSSTQKTVQRLTDESKDALKTEIVTQGYSIDDLKRAITEKAEKEHKTQKLVKTSKKEIERIYRELVSECYTQLYRIQDELTHNTPRSEPDNDQGTGKGADLWAQTKDDIEEQGLVGLMAASHTYGLKDTSSFVSLCQDVEALASTSDIGDGKENVSNVIENAKYLCEYWVPNEFKWTPKEMFDRIKASKEWNDSPMFGGDDTMPEDWVLNTPVKETEVLYFGWDLAKYGTNSLSNPYKKKEK